MHTYIKALYPHNQRLIGTDLFGYATQGIPGLEVVGAGKHSRALKEKLVFLTKKFNKKMPLKRFVLCCDEVMEKSEYFKYMELPLLILYWSLADLLPIKNLEDCLCSGYVELNGKICQPDLELFQKFDFKGQVPIVTEKISSQVSKRRVILLEELMEQFSF